MPRTEPYPRPGKMPAFPMQYFETPSSSLSAKLQKSGAAVLRVSRFSIRQTTLVCHRRAQTMALVVPANKNKIPPKKDLGCFHKASKTSPLVFSMFLFAFALFGAFLAPIGSQDASEGLQDAAQGLHNASQTLQDAFKSLQRLS